MKLSLKILVCMMIVSIAPSVSFADGKYALVIGNSAYKEGRLKNPVNDARLMAKTLKELNFEILGGDAKVNLGREEMSMLLIEFGHGQIYGRKPAKSTIPAPNRP